MEMLHSIPTRARLKHAHSFDRCETSPTIPSLLSQHPSPYSFYLDAYLVGLEPQAFGFPLDSCPDALQVSHGDLDASSTIL